MNTRSLALSACAVVAVCVGTLSAQNPRDQIRSTARPAGTSEISILVTTDEREPKPLRRVSVTLQAGEIDVPNIAVTDDEGRVRFRNLAAGNYLLTAFRTGYVRTFYGSKFPGRGPGVAVTVFEGKPASVQIRMLRGGVITGTVRETSGRPAPNRPIQVVQVRSSGGERRAVSLEATVGGVITDDRGVYRLFGLAPGDYLVLAPAPGIGAEEFRPVTAEELRWADARVASTPGGSAPPAPEPAEPVAYAPVYFPGTAVASDASVVTLGPGEERAGVDFTLQRVPTAIVSGRVLDNEGRPQPGVTIQLRPVRPDGLDLFSALFNANGGVDADGMFTIRGVKPGSYQLTARATIKPGAAPSQDSLAQAKQQMAAIMGGGGATHWASESVNVAGRDVGGLQLTLRPGITISGRIVYEATTKEAPKDYSKSQISLMTAPTGTGMNDLMASLTGAATLRPDIKPDGAFTINGVAPGRYRLNTPFAMIPIPGMAAMGGGWTLKSVMAGGRDIADAPLDVTGSTDISGVVVTFTDSPGELSGVVMDGAGRQTSDFPIVVFSTDRAYWTPGSRRVQSSRPSSDGRYTIAGLPAGEYFVCAVTAVDRSEIYDHAFLEQLAPVSFKIALKDGEKKTQDLKLGGG